MVQQFDVDLLEFIRQHLNNGPLPDLEAMAATTEGYLHLGSIIIEYIEQNKDKGSFGSNKKQALEQGNQTTGSISMQAHKNNLSDLTYRTLVLQRQPIIAILVLMTWKKKKKNYRNNQIKFLNWSYQKYQRTINLSHDSYLSQDKVILVLLSLWI